LHPEPRRRLDARSVEQALVFAFASGGQGETLDRLALRAELEPSSFAPDCFAKDLFVAEFVNLCTAFTIAGRRHQPHAPRLTRLLSHPPADLAVVEFRQRTLRELMQRPELRRALEDAYVKLRELFTLLESSDTGKHFDPVARRLEILRATARAIDGLAEAFAGAESGLARASLYAREVQRSAAYEHLRQLLDHEGHLATVRVDVTLAYDGHLRGLEIVRAEENASNRFYVSPLKRLLTRLRLFFRGYHLRQTEVLGRLINSVFDGVAPFLVDAIELWGALEFYLAALGFADLARSKKLDVCLPSLSAVHGGAEPPETPSELEGLFNPFLLHEEKPPKSCDLRIEASGFVIVTGPNSGGKTRLLQALGLCQLLAQNGFVVPAAAARLGFRRGLFVSIVDEVSVDQREGRLGSELLRIRRLFESLSMGATVILDELCSGTNPSEAEEIFRLVLELLAELKPQVFISTHFLHFAERLRDEAQVPGLSFLQVELDDQQCPTYHFVPGVASTSLARMTAERLGVTREALRSLVEAARGERAASSSAPRGDSPLPSPPKSAQARLGGELK